MSKLSRTSGSGFVGNPHLFPLMSDDRPFVLFARQSGKRGASTNRLVYQDLMDAADGIRSRLAVDVIELVPSFEEVDAALRAAEPVSSVDDVTGSTFTNTFTVFDFRPSAPVIMICSAGTAHKVDADTMAQPAVMYLAGAMVKYRPSLLAAKRRDRWFRVGWAQSPFWMKHKRLEDRGIVVQLAAADAGLVDISELGQAMSLIEGSKAGYQAEAFLKTAQSGMSSLTEKRQMSLGWVSYHLSGNPPPGFARIEVRATGKVRRQIRLYLDDPSVWPAPHAVLGQLPGVLDEDGKVVNQVENIRWFLATAGTGDISRAELARLLAKRHYSTSLGRRRFGNIAAKPSPDNVRVILHNLPVYETGALRLQLVHEVVTLENLFPADGGPWAQPEDFAHIRAWMKHRQVVVGHRISSTFSGLQVQANGESWILRPTAGNGANTAQQSVRYGLHRSQTDQVPISARLHLQHEWLAESILEALATSDREPVPIPIPQLDTDDEARALEARHFDHTQQLRTLQSQIDRLERDAQEVDPETGDHVLPASVRTERWKSYEQKRLLAIRCEEAIEQINQEITEHTEFQRRLARGVEISAILALLASLKNPRDIRYASVWRRAIRDFTITSEDYGTPSGHKISLPSWTFKLYLTDGETIFTVPGSGTAAAYAMEKYTSFPNLIIDQLREGKIGVGRGYFRSYLPPIRAALGVDDATRTPYLKGDDPQLMRLTMAVMHPSVLRTAEPEKEFAWTLDDTQWVDTFAQPQVLARRLTALYGPGRIWQWLQKPARLETLALVHAALHDGEVEPSAFGYRYDAFRGWLHASGQKAYWNLEADQIRLSPCASCGSFKQASLRILEPTGYVCLRCRRDQSGVTWPAAPYDRYITTPEQWRVTGVVLVTEREAKRGQVLDDVPQVSLPHDTYRPIDDLSAEETANLIDLYLRHGHSIREMARKFELNHHELSAYLGALGVRRVHITPAQVTPRARTYHVG